MEPLAPHRLDAAALAREYRVWFEVSRDTVLARDGRRTLALELRLWATLPAGSSAMPGTPGSRDACRALTRVAEAVVARAERGAEAEIEPFRSALYASRQLPGRDEIHLGIALRGRGGQSQGGLDERERRLKALVRRLEALAVFEGGWREPTREAPARAAADQWEVRHPARVFEIPAREATPRPVRPSGPGPLRARAATG